MGSAAVQYNNLNMEVDTHRQLLDELLKRQSETEVTARLQATRESNVRVVDLALTPGAAYLPSVRRDVGMALGLGLFLGIGCILLLEYLDRSIKTAEEAERVLSLPVLAVIPTFSSARRTVRRLLRQLAQRQRGLAAQASARRRAGQGQGQAEELKESSCCRRPSRGIPSPSLSLVAHALLLSSAERLRVIALTSAHSGEARPPPPPTSPW